MVGGLQRVFRKNNEPVEERQVVEPCLVRRRTKAALHALNVNPTAFSEVRAVSPEHVQKRFGVHTT